MNIAKTISMFRSVFVLLTVAACPIWRCATNPAPFDLRPTVIVTSDTTVGINDTLVLSGIAVNSTGDTLWDANYEWWVPENGTLVRSANSNRVTFAVGAQPETLECWMKAAHSSAALKGEARVLVSVVWGSPIVVLSDDTIVCANDSFTVGVSVDDHYGGISGYRIDANGNGIYVESDTMPEFLFLRAPSHATTRRILLQVEDDDGNRASDTMMVTVLEAALGITLARDTTVWIMDTFALYGSARDIRDSIVLYRFDLDGDGVFDDSSSSFSTRHLLAPPGPDTLRLIVQVENHRGDRVSDTMRVIVLPSLPVLAISADTTLTINDTFSLHGTATDRRHAIVLYRFDMDGDGVFDDSSATFPEKSMVAPAIRDTLRIIVQAENSMGGIDTDTMMVRVLQDLPRLMLSGRSTVTINDSFAVEAAARDRGTVEVFRVDMDGDGTFDDSSSTPATWNFRAPSFPGTLKVAVQVEDDDGNKVTKTMTVSVLQDPPILTFSRDTSVTVTDSFSLRGAASDRGSIVVYRIDMDGDGAFDDSSSTPDTWWFRAPSTPGSLDVMLQVEDEDGNKVTKIMTVHFMPTPPPVADAGPDVFVDGPTTVVLNGTGTDTYGGSIVDYEWKIGDGDWSHVTDGDTSFVMLQDTQTVVCSLRVTDDDGNMAVDAMFARVSMSARKVAARAGHSFAITTDGTLWAWGNNRFGQLGNGTTNHVHVPEGILRNVESVFPGHRHTLILKTDGSLWVCGENRYGQLGIGSTADMISPVHVADNVQTAAAGLNHSLIVKSDGSLWACGANHYGQLPNDTVSERSTPVQVMGGVKSVAAGMSYSMIVKDDGSLLACGTNEFGELGDGSKNSRKTPVKVSTATDRVAANLGYTIIMKKDKSVWTCGNNDCGQIGDGTYTLRTSPVPTKKGICEAAAGDCHALFLEDDFTLWASGSNSLGQYGIGNDASSNNPITVADKVKSIAAGGNHSLILKEDGSVWATGSNQSGQLGNGTTDNKMKFVRSML